MMSTGKAAAQLGITRSWFLRLAKLAHVDGIAFERGRKVKLMWTDQTVGDVQAYRSGMRRPRGRHVQPVN